MYSRISLVPLNDPDMIYIMSGSFNVELCCTCVIFILSFTHLNDEDYSMMHLTPYITIIVGIRCVNKRAQYVTFPYLPRI